MSTNDSNKNLLSAIIQALGSFFEFLGNTGGGCLAVIVALIALVGIVFEQLDFTLSPGSVPLSCNDSLIEFRISSQSGENRLTLPNTLIQTEPGETLVVHAFLNEIEVGQLVGVSCDWTHTGDGHILSRSKCSLQLQAGYDNTEDLVTLRVDQESCANARLATFRLALEEQK